MSMKKYRVWIIALLCVSLLWGCTSENEKKPEGSATPTEGAKKPTEEVKQVTPTEAEKQPTPAEGQPTPTEKPKEEGKMATVLYQGHGSLRVITAEEKVIYIDPFFGEGYDLPADLILMTHGHYDHTQDNLITTKNADCVKITWAEALKDGVHQSFDLGFVKVEAVEAGYNKNHNAKECVGYVLTFSDGVTLYVSGDTSTTPTMPALAERNLDYAFFCCDGFYNMGVAEASECAKAVGAKHSIPYHMIPANKGGFDRSVAESFTAEGRIILEPKEELKLQ